MEEEEEKLIPPSRLKSYAIQPDDSGTSLTRKISDTRLTTVTYSVAIALIGSFLFGYAIGYSSPVNSDLGNKKINNTNETQEGYLGRKEYQEIFNALMPIGALVGAPLAGWLVDYIGRKKSLLLCSVPFAIGWVITVLSHATTHGTIVRVLLFAGRFFVGIGVGGASLCVPLYITEISPTSLRGLYGAANQLAVTIGLFVAELVGSFIPYYWLAMIPLGLTCVFGVFVLSLYETPRWLISHGQNLKAGRVLIWLRGSRYDVINEQREIENQISSEVKLSFSETVQEFKTKPVYHPLILALFLMFFQQFCGINAIIFNAEETFTGVVTHNAALISSLAVGLTQVLATFVGVILTDLLGRRTLLISGALIMCVSITAAGVYEFLQYHEGKDHLGALGIGGLIVYNIGFSIGWGALPWLMTNELIPLRVRGAGVGIATFFNWLLVAIVTGGYQTYQDAVKTWSAFWSFGLVCFLALLFVAFFLPETKRRSLEDIEKSFETTVSIRRSSEL